MLDRETIPGSHGGTVILQTLDIPAYGPPTLALMDGKDYISLGAQGVRALRDYCDAWLRANAPA